MVGRIRNINEIFFHVFLYFKIEERNKLELFGRKHESMRLEKSNQMVFFIF
jgi:hypothetical protein